MRLLVRLELVAPVRERGAGERVTGRDLEEPGHVRIEQLHQEALVVVHGDVRGAEGEREPEREPGERRRGAHPGHVDRNVERAVAADAGAVVLLADRLVDVLERDRRRRHGELIVAEAVEQARRAEYVDPARPERHGADLNPELGAHHAVREITLGDGLGAAPVRRPVRRHELHRVRLAGHEAPVEEGDLLVRPSDEGPHRCARRRWLGAAATRGRGRRCGETDERAQERHRCQSGNPAALHPHVVRLRLFDSVRWAANARSAPFENARKPSGRP